MIQIVTVNSALSQDWVGCTGCTPKTLTARMLRLGRAHKAVSWRTGRRVVAPSGSVTVRMGALARHVVESRPAVSQPPRHDTKFLSRYNSCHARSVRTARCVASAAPYVVLAAARVAAFLCRVAGRCCAISQPLACCVATPGLPLLSRYNRLYRDTPQRPSHARALLLAPRAGRPCRGPLLAVSWLCRSTTARPITHPLGRIMPWRPYCVTIQYAVS